MNAVDSTKKPNTIGELGERLRSENRHLVYDDLFGEGDDRKKFNLLDLSCSPKINRGGLDEAKLEKYHNSLRGYGTVYYKGVVASLLLRKEGASVLEIAETLIPYYVDKGSGKDSLKDFRSRIDGFFQNTRNLNQEGEIPKTLMFGVFRSSQEISGARGSARYKACVLSSQGGNHQEPLTLESANGLQYKPLI